MLKENEITMVLTVAKPEMIPYAPTLLKLVKNKDKQWHVILKWDPVLNRVLIKEQNKDMQKIPMWDPVLKKVSTKEQKKRYAWFHTHNWIVSARKLVVYFK